MEPINWAPVSVVAMVVTGVVALATLDVLTVTVTAASFTAGFATGRRYVLRHPSDPSRDGDNRE